MATLHWGVKYVMDLLTPCLLPIPSLLIGFARTIEGPIQFNDFILDDLGKGLLDLSEVNFVIVVRD